MKGYFNFSKAEVSLSDCYMSYPGHSFPSCRETVTYSTATADWAWFKMWKVFLLHLISSVLYLVLMAFPQNSSRLWFLWQQRTVCIGKKNKCLGRLKLRYSSALGEPGSLYHPLYHPTTRAWHQWNPNNPQKATQYPSLQSVSTSFVVTDIH